MPEYISDVIEQLNYQDNFGFTKPDLPNVTYQNDALSNGQYSEYVRNHVRTVMNIWFNDTGIESAEPYEHGTNPDGTYPAHSLRWIAENEFSVDKKILADLDNIIRAHDRSRYTYDEFYPMGNARFSSQAHENDDIYEPLLPDDQKVYDIARATHYHRNPHHLQYYLIHGRGEVASAAEMPDLYIWEMIADWIANISITFPQPFIYYWGSKYSKQVKIYYYDDYPLTQDVTVTEVYTNTVPISESSSIDVPYAAAIQIHTIVYHDVYMWYQLEDRDPIIPWNMPVAAQTRQRIESIIARWQPEDDGGMDNPDIPYIPGTTTPMSPGIENAQKISRTTIVDNYNYDTISV